MSDVKHSEKRRDVTVEELEALEAIELPAREAMGGGCGCGLISVPITVVLKDVNVLNVAVLGVIA